LIDDGKMMENGRCAKIIAPARIAETPDKPQTAAQFGLATGVGKTKERNSKIFQMTQ
jgi:hypothetical protein